MQNRSTPFLQQDRNLLIFLVVVGYIVTFITAANGDTKYSALRIVVGVLFGVGYLAMAMFDTELLRGFTGNTHHVVYFSIQIAFVFGIGWMLGPGGNWLMGLPLANIAVDRLSPRGRWPVYLGIVAAFVLPILHYSTWETALMNGLIISVGVLFSVLLSQVRLNEQHAREKAEALASQLEQANRQLAEYVSQVEELAATQERNRLAREIHDNLGHYLTIVNVQLEAARLTLDSEPARAMDALTKAQDLAKKGLTSVRESVAALRVSPVENRPLDDAIAELIEEARVSGVATNFKIIGNIRPVESKSALALYRVVQEGLTNVRKHASASRVDIELNFSEADTIRLTLRDDGIGAADTSGGFGLIGLRERVHLLDGEFKVETEIGKGFQLDVSIPASENS
ncbi:MAG: sensor histidine kinase [Anaerolineales bacterium]|nr:sensor histidine kinase [Anaerolineales bacterium]NTW12569.1 sensor histidine kinase [Anaerolineales bacterium]